MSPSVLLFVKSSNHQEISDIPVSLLLELCLLYLPAPASAPGTLWTLGGGSTISAIFRMTRLFLLFLDPFLLLRLEPLLLHVVQHRGRIKIDGHICLLQSCPPIRKAFDRDFESDDPLAITEFDSRDADKLILAPTEHQFFNGFPKWQQTTTYQSFTFATRADCAVW